MLADLYNGISKKYKKKSEAYNQFLYSCGYLDASVASVKNRYGLWEIDKPFRDLNPLKVETLNTLEVQQANSKGQTNSIKNITGFNSSQSKGFF